MAELFRLVNSFNLPRACDYFLSTFLASCLIGGLQHESCFSIYWEYSSQLTNIRHHCCTEPQEDHWQLSQSGSWTPLQAASAKGSPRIAPDDVSTFTSSQHWSCRWRLHKAEVHVMDRGEIYYTQPCRSWRWAAEIVMQEKILCHCYWGMGLTSQHPLVHGLVVRLAHDKQQLMQPVNRLNRSSWRRSAFVDTDICGRPMPTDKKVSYSTRWAVRSSKHAAIHDAHPCMMHPLDWPAPWCCESQTNLLNQLDSGLVVNTAQPWTSL